MDGERPSGRHSDNTVIWIVGGLIVVCVCVVGAIGVAMLGAGALSYATVRSVAVSAPVAAPTLALTPLNQPTERAFATQGRSTPTSADQPAGVTIDVPDMGRDHIPEGASVVYNSNPPTSGPHYPSPLPGGFYIESVPDGYVVHSMEHGYVVIWYNCADLSEDDCRSLKDDIQNLITGSTQTKLIGIPRDGLMGHTIALTSWGKLAYLDEFDADFIHSFIDENILQAPEPGGP